MVVLSWSSSLWDSLISLFTNLETFDTRVESNTIIILSWSSLEFITLNSIRMRSRWRRSKINIWRSCLCQRVSSLMIILSWSCSLWDSLLSLFWDLETLDTSVESNSIIILSRSTLKLTTLSSISMWPWWWRSKIDVWSLCLCKVVSQLMVILSRTCCGWDILWSFLSDFKTLDTRVKPDTIIILSRSSLEFTTLHSICLRSGWRGS